MEYYFSRKLHNKWNWQFGDEIENRQGQSLNVDFKLEKGLEFKKIVESSASNYVLLECLFVLVCLSATEWKVLSVSCGMEWIPTTEKPHKLLIIFTAAKRRHCLSSGNVCYPTELHQTCLINIQLLWKRKTWHLDPLSTQTVSWDVKC